MTGRVVDAARAGQERQPSDYAGAIYGSLLAASVVAGTGPGQEPRTRRPVDRHCCSRPAWCSGSPTSTPIWSGSDRPTAAVPEEVPRRCEAGLADRAGRRTSRGGGGVGALLGLSDAGAAWLALAVAVGSQLGWALYVAAKAGATRGRMAVSGLVNLVLGLVIVALKAPYASALRRPPRVTRAGRARS